MEEPQYEQVIFMKGPEAIDRLNRDSLLAICVLCNHVDWQHGDYQGRLCGCCKTAIPMAPLAVRFEKRMTVQYRFSDHVNILVRHPVLVEWS